MIKNVKKQPLEWRQAISFSPNRGLSLRNIILSPLINYCHSFKNHKSILFGYIIIGSNPIINLLLLIKIANETKSKNQNQSIGILSLEENDYWAYHMLEHTWLWREVSQYLHADISSFNDLVQYFNNILDCNHIQIYFINSESYYIEEGRHDQAVDGWIFHLQKKFTTNLTNYQKAFPTISQIETNIKDKNNDVLRSILGQLKNVNTVNFFDPIAISSDRNGKSHILLSYKVYLSSLPSHWINSTHTVVSHETKFSHALLNYSFGTASRIANNFDSLEQQAIDDIIQFLKIL